MPSKRRNPTPRGIRRTVLLLFFFTALIHSWASDSDSVAGLPFAPLKRGQGPVPFSFIVYGDIQENHRRAHGALVQHMLTEKASFVLNTGDISPDDGKGYAREFLPVVRELVKRIPFFPALGNHDVDWMSPHSRSRFAKFFRRGFQVLSERESNSHLADLAAQKLWYSFRFADVLFIALDSNFFIHEGKYKKTHRLKPYQGHLKEQLNWLREELAKASRNPAIRAKFVFFHHSPIVSHETNPLPILGWGGHPGHTRMLIRHPLPDAPADEVRYLLDLFRKYRVTAVFSGHEHFYERWQEVIYRSGRPQHVINWVVTGLGGTRPRGKPEYKRRKIQSLLKEGELYREYLDRVSELDPEWTAELHHPYPSENDPRGRFHNYVLVRIDGNQVRFQTKDSLGKIRDRGFLAPVEEVVPPLELRRGKRRVPATATP